MRFLKTAAVTVAVVAAMAGSTIIASAYPPPTEVHRADCDPGHVKADDGTCKLVFVDKEPKGSSAGQTICFTVTGPGAVTPRCSLTNSSGKATATYEANAVHCGTREADSTKAVIRGTEHGDDRSTAQTTVVVECPSDESRGHDSAVAGSSHGVNATLTNTAARISNPTASAGGIALGGGILLVIAVLSVAITGRLRLRGLRR